MSTRPAEAPPIFTLTGNLLAERTLEFARWSPGKTNRAERESFQVGGKGINVSKMLTRLGVPNTALCFTGGAPGAECEAWLRGRGFSFRAFTTNAPTRAGTVVREAGGSHAETTFLEPDVPPDGAAVKACAEFLNAQPAGGILALCGSFPGWASASLDHLSASLDSWSGKGMLVVDTYGPALSSLIELPVALLKINADELNSLGHSRLEEIPDHVERTIITDGPHAVRIREAGGATETFVPPAIREVSPTGSGDVLLACVLEALFVRRLPLRDAVSFAIPYAAANAAHPGIAEFPPLNPDS
ncbi:MAG: PfkB family carbohydrate kinase [Opitutaceae bacterium]